MNRRSRLFSSALLVLVASTGVAPAALAACQNGVQQFDYPAQRLDSALQQFAHTTGCFVKVDTAKLGDTQAPALNGRFTAAAALVQLVRGTGFEMHVADDQYRVDHSDQQWIDKQVKRSIASVRKAHESGALDDDTAKTRITKLRAIKKEARGLIRHQGFLSAAEHASYERVFDAYTRQSAPTAG